jgi:hypothetical protein
MHFYVQGATSVETNQPEVLITMSGYAQAASNKSDFSIETLVSARNMICKNKAQNDLGLGNCP